jgi:hypothetical protein
MITFLLKKTFYDLWDNAPRLALLNIGFTASLALFLIIRRLFEAFSPVPFAVSGLVFFVGIIWHSVYLAAAAACLKNISDYKTFGFNDFCLAFRSLWSAGIAYGVYISIAVLLFTFVIPFYLLTNSPAGLFIASLLFWTLVVFAAAFQYFFAVRIRFGMQNESGLPSETPGKTPLFPPRPEKIILLSKFGKNANVKSIKKCFMLFIDNPLFFAGTMFLTLLFLPLSIFVLPGPAGILLFLDEALRLRLLKYDWLEQNIGADRKYIPWDTILAGEREKTGGRTLRALIFPWKD